MNDDHQEREHNLQEREHKLKRIKSRLIEMGLVIDSPSFEKTAQHSANESVLTSPICSIAGCRLKHYKSGFCKKHYKSSRPAKAPEKGKNLEA
jgi:hypothetical protein